MYEPALAEQAKPKSGDATGNMHGLPKIEPADVPQCYL